MKDRHYAHAELPAALRARVSRFVALRARYYAAEALGLTALALSALAAHPIILRTAIHPLTEFVLSNAPLFFALVILAGMYYSRSIVERERAALREAFRAHGLHAKHAHARIHDDRTVTLTNKEPSVWQRFRHHHVSLR
ncbi:MAG: hypothetical protein WC607_01225 [Candidatus Micrarchaeia archaeon]